ncbi:hypothetical protein [Secundilactobacillus kimchicus]|uniref:hypothetical protein n=1 Tax=Secundilactobacillus kimchicus TaxID=528209 RepID=UPI0024A93397|nr:hypothetical protein [Secundilactobacillus kimchicus]
MKRVSKQVRRVLGVAAVVAAGLGSSTVVAHALVTSPTETVLERTNSELST